VGHKGTYSLYLGYWQPMAGYHRRT